MRNKNRETIEEMKMILDENRSLTLENFVMPHEEEQHQGDVMNDNSFDEEPPMRNTDDNQSEGEEKDDITGIEKELTQIRKIALSVINRLADQPTCPQYDTMKKIWNMVDKAIEQPQTGNKPVE